MEKTGARIRSAVVVLGGVAAILTAAPCEAVAHTCTMSTWSDMAWFDCDDDGSTIIFGMLKDSAGTNQGVGVCVKSGVTVMDLEHDSTSSRVHYQVFAGGGGDVVRLATTDADENCSFADHTGWKIRGVLWSSAVFYEFDGEDGDDYVYLCDQGSPASGDCLSNDSAAYGGAGTNRIHGTTNDDDELYGGAGTDYIWGYDDGDTIYGYGGVDYIDGGDGAEFIYGGDGNDWIWGNDGGDWLYGGDGCDQLVGMEDDDTIYGEAGCDNIWGGGGSDTCSCGSVANDGVHVSGCEGTAVNCGSCSC